MKLFYKCYITGAYVCLNLSVTLAQSINDIRFYHIHEAAKFNYYFMIGIISYQAAQTDQLRRTQCMV